MSFEPRDYLRHILVEADYLIERSSGVSSDEFHGAPGRPGGTEGGPEEVVHVEEAQRA